MTLIAEYRKIAEEILPLDSSIMVSLGAFASIGRKKGAHLLASYKERIKRLAKANNIALPDCINEDMLPTSVTKNGVEIPIIYAMSHRELPPMYKMFGNFALLDDIVFIQYCLAHCIKQYKMNPSEVYLSEFHVMVPIEESVNNSEQ